MKTVQFSFDKETLRHKAVFINGQEAISSKWLTSVEEEGLQEVFSLTRPDGRPVLHDAGTICDAIENSEVFFDTEEETNFEIHLMELLSE